MLLWSNILCPLFVGPLERLHCKSVISEIPENFPTLVLSIWDLPYKTSPTGTVNSIIVSYSEYGDYITHLFIQESSSEVLVC